MLWLEPTDQGMLQPVDPDDAKQAGYSYSSPPELSVVQSLCLSTHLPRSVYLIEGRNEYKDEQ